MMKHDYLMAIVMSVCWGHSWPQRKSSGESTTTSKGVSRLKCCTTSSAPNFLWENTSWRTWHDESQDKSERLEDSRNLYGKKFPQSVSESLFAWTTPSTTIWVKLNVKVRESQCLLQYLMKEFFILKKEEEEVFSLSWWCIWIPRLSTCRWDARRSMMQMNLLTKLGLLYLGNSNIFYKRSLSIHFFLIILNREFAAQFCRWNYSSFTTCLFVLDKSSE